MPNRIETDQMRIEYTESWIERPVLWESHCHSRYEMIAVLEGDISVMMEGKSHRLTENQAVIVPPLYYHTVTANEKGKYRRVTALFDGSAIPHVLQARFLERDASLTTFPYTRIEELKRLCMESDRDFYLPLAEAMMVEILYAGLQAADNEEAEQDDPFLRQVISYIDEHLCEKILLEDLALHTARSKSSFCHLFQMKMNISPKQYILQKKMALANKLIHDGTPPTAASLQIGYENYSNFYRLYSKLYGENPRKK